MLFFHLPCSHSAIASGFADTINLTEVSTCDLKSLGVVCVNGCICIAFIFHFFFCEAQDVSGQFSILKWDFYFCGMREGGGAICVCECVGSIDAQMKIMAKW